MPYITREDGERFIIPTYRDVLSAKKPSLLKKEILLLAANYGEYITLQKKGNFQYEVAFSPEAGNLLGETVWHFFKRPRDLIYCEEIPNTTDVILVIVKSGSVYLDGSFPADSVPEELIVFQTQQNNFEIYTYGDVPISETAEPGKFAFDTTSVKSFKVLDKPVFATLPLVKSFQLQMVDVVLKQQGIGVFPIKNVVFLIILAGLLWYGWSFISKPKVVQTTVSAPPNPYEEYIQALAAPDTSSQIKYVSQQIVLLLTIPGWVPTEVVYTPGTLIASVQSLGARSDILFSWAAQNNAVLSITEKGIFLNFQQYFPNRKPVTAIARLNEVIARVLDKVSYIVPGNVLVPSKFIDKGQYKTVELTISFKELTPDALTVLGLQMQSLPLVLSKIEIDVKNGILNGTIVVNALGN